MAEQEFIIFVDDNGTPTGEVGPKLESHNAHTKRHFAFSCYIFRPSDNKFLVTQRALSKKVWPGVWTNSVCGHPAPGEAIEDAIRRRAKDELGITDLDTISCVVPIYTYTTPPYKGIVENEFCPIFIARTPSDPLPNPSEVEAYQWISWADYVAMLEARSDDMSYWAKDQYRVIESLEPFSSL